jgi:tetratricopeptide (TPR) repeat protein
MVSQAQSTLGADRNADFLAALRKRGWDDTAVEYLAWVEKSPLITQAFREELPYQRAMSLAAQARETNNATQRDRLLDQAAAEFQSFAKQAPSSAAALDALKESATLYGQQGFDALAAAKQLSEQAATQLEEARGKARDAFAKAAAATDQIIAISTKELAALPKPVVIQADVEAKAKRDDLRNRQLEARFLRARLSFEQAFTYREKLKERIAALEAASAQFGQLNDEFRESLIGASSRFYQGRCAQELGAYQKALDYYEDLTRNPTAKPEFRVWTARAVRHRAECLLALDKTEAAIDSSQEWLAASQAAERQQPEWLEVAYRLAEAMQAKAKDGDGKPNESKRMPAEVRNLLRDVAQRPNEFQQEARVGLAAMGSRTQNGAELKTFEQAFAAGEEAVNLMNSSNVAARLAQQNNPDGVEELQQQADDNRSEALRALQAALNLADRQTPVDKLNRARYYLSVLLYEEKETFDAAVLAEFLATKYPESEFAPTAAKVALAAYEQLAAEARASAKQGISSASDAGAYETAKLGELAQLIATRWPQAPEAAAAANLMIQTAIRENRLDEAEALLAKLPEASRGSAQLTLGAALWTQYLRNTAGQREAPSESAIVLRDKAGDQLGAGFTSLRKSGELTSTSAAGALYLVQYLLAKGDSKAALEVLQDEKVGPLTLVNAKDEVASRPEFILETYKTALRTFLSAAPPEREQGAAMMKTLDDFVTKQGGEKAAQQLTDVYLGLGVQLQRQLKELSASGQIDKAQQVAVAFGDVLDRVAQRPDADAWRIRTWLAQTNLQLGQVLTGKAADEYVDRAMTSFQAILDAAAKDPKYAPDKNAVLGVRMRMAECQAARGQFDKAMEQYAIILREKSTLLDLQQSAAATLQQWGVAKQDRQALEKSIHGDLPQKDGSNIIWGWLRIATVADAAKRAAQSGSTGGANDRAARFEDLFFEARFNVAKARYLVGTVLTGAERREQFEAAQTNIEQMQRLYPDLGGPKWKPAFDDLLKQINQELAKK